MDTPLGSFEVVKLSIGSRERASKTVVWLLPELVTHTCDPSGVNAMRLGLLPPLGNDATIVSVAVEMTEIFASVRLAAQTSLPSGEIAIPSVPGPVDMTFTSPVDLSMTLTVPETVFVT